MSEEENITSKPSKSDSTNPFSPRISLHDISTHIKKYEEDLKSQSDYECRKLKLLVIKFIEYIGYEVEESHPFCILLRHYLLNFPPKRNDDESMNSRQKYPNEESSDDSDDDNRIPKTYEPSSSTTNLYGRIPGRIYEGGASPLRMSDSEPEELEPVMDKTSYDMRNRQNGLKKKMPEKIADLRRSSPLPTPRIRSKGK